MSIQNTKTHHDSFILALSEALFSEKIRENFSILEGDEMIEALLNEAKTNLIFPESTQTDEDLIYQGTVVTEHREAR